MKVVAGIAVLNNFNLNFLTVNIGASVLKKYKECENPGIPLELQLELSN